MAAFEDANRWIAPATRRFRDAIGHRNEIRTIAFN
jgi:hypothetical protein